MNRIMLVLAAVCSMAASADERIGSAIDDVMRYSCLTNWTEYNSVAEWGVPDELLAEPSFTNLVDVVRARIGNCDASFACGMTNDVRREVFIAALAECGDAVYTNAVVRWFGGAVPSGTSAEMVDAYVAPATTRMEGYCIEHFDDPAISNVWLKVKSLYLSEGNVDAANGIDGILNGESKAEREMMKAFEKEGKRKK